MSDSSNVDILNIAGIERSTFYNAGEDVILVRDKERKPFARVFRKGGKIVYRSGCAVVWNEEQERRDH